ncbi:efflux RND transporter periplasmic adaptor subunit [Sphingomonas nostoxanthinifaciens]|uniref:efflux RND transporter periplasmic adaptor subunit n=1 Tax=Sphingomonas nostoxanthinifaciens TaxID=2872652 RepID=UPI001CC206EF|nr:efflux RND transporter periplasmic adaptor subunit [Sphingomonas nostoxanthinifaciens]UAK25790.1 efflux RND transporter periplasmic adaptor subunit [Sphingomonas nostoxanthinifaciens]
MNETIPAGHEPTQRVSLRWKLAGLALVALAVMLGMASLHRSGAGQNPPAAAAKTVPVVAGRAATRDMAIRVTGIGSVTPINVVDVKARVDGQLMRIAYREGDEVPAGRLLAQIDPRPYEATLAQAVALRAKDDAQLVNARSDLARQATLSKAGAGTVQAYDAAKAQAGALQATVAQDDAAIRSAQLNLQYSRIVAPVAGRVGLKQVNLGAMVHASDTTGIVTVTQMAPISVIFTLPQDALAPVLAGQHGGQLPVSVYTRDGASHIVDGTLVFVGSSVDQTTGQFQLRANFANGDRMLWPGDFVSVRVLVRLDRGATVVPDQAVQTSETGRYVYTLTPGGVAEMRTVKAGASVDGFTEILAGLKPGDAIVVSGQSRLSPGAKVAVRGQYGARS